MARTLITLPSVIRLGDVIEIRTLIAHPMETGYRPGADGKVLPRDILTRFSCEFLATGQSAMATATRDIVLEADLYPAIAANPYLSFYFSVQRNGVLRFQWLGDNGFSQTETRAITLA